MYQLFIGGEAPDKNILSDIQFDHTYAVDSGYSVCNKWGIIPEILLGDFDSIPKDLLQELPNTIRTITLSRNKTYTDTSVCLLYLQRLARLENLIPEITIVGGFGERVDHFIEHLELFKRSYTPNRYIGKRYQIEHLANDSIPHISSSKCINTELIADPYISIMPLSENVKVHAMGLKWKLDALSLSSQFSSLSNEYVSSEVTIEVISGRVMVIWAHKNRPQIY